MSVGHAHLGVVCISTLAAMPWSGSGENFRAEQRIEIAVHNSCMIAPRPRLFLREPTLLIIRNEDSLLKAPLARAAENHAP